MPFQPGESGNKNGRPKGARNVNTERLRSIVADLLEDNAEKVLSDMKALKPRERVQAWTALLEYALPKLQRSELNFNLDDLTDGQVDELLQRALGIAEPNENPTDNG